MTIRDRLKRLEAARRGPAYRVLTTAEVDAEVRALADLLEGANCPARRALEADLEALDRATARATAPNLPGFPSGEWPITARLGRPQDPKRR